MKIENKIKALLVLIPIFSLLACQNNQLGQHKQTTDKSIARLFVEAYNRHDAEAMLALTHKDIRYMYVANDKIYTETDGKQKLADFLDPFFINKPKAQSRIVAERSDGPFINVEEQAIWFTDDGEEKSQCSLSVYQIKEQLIINIWYFDVHPCDG